MNKWQAKFDRYCMQLIKILLLFFASFYTSFGFGAFNAELTPNPLAPESGDNTLTIKITDEQGQPIENATISLLIYMPAMGSMPRMEEKAKVSVQGSGIYVAQYTLSMGGSWEVELSIEKGDQKEVLNYSLTTGIEGFTSKNETKVSSKDRQTTTNLVAIGPERLQKIGVRFVEAKTMLLEKTIRAVGLVEPDNTKKTEVVLRFPGYVEKQFVGRVGDHVKAGTPLFTVYSPELVAAQGEFLLAHGSHGANDSLQVFTRDRLKNLGLSERDIARIKKQGKPQRNVIISAPQSGTILEVNVREGSGFSQGQLLYAIGDLSKNYIVARIFQRDLSNLRVGQSVEIIIPEADEASYIGKIDLIYPNISEGEGTANVRVEVGEEVMALKPGIYVDLRFPVNLGNCLVIPIKAILYSGLHKYVFIDRGEGVLEPREINTGKVSSEWVEVKSGLNEGDRVVASGAFLISSEAQLRSALPKWKKADTKN